MVCAQLSHLKELTMKWLINQYVWEGAKLNEQWELKRNLTNKISNKEIDDIYDAGIEAGALGGKLLGAGGGGFMLFYVQKNKQKKVKEALKSKLFVPFRLENTGSKIIYYSHEDEYI